MKAYSLSLLLFCLPQSHAFLTPMRQSQYVVETNLFSSSAFPEGLINVVKIDPKTYDTDDDQIMQVASYRNQLTSPEQMIAAQQAKRDSFDPTQSAIEGMKIGLGIGAAAGIVTAVGSEAGLSLQDQAIAGLTNFAAIGLTTVSSHIIF